jgi:hypothetical protein
MFWSTRDAIVATIIVMVIGYLLFSGLSHLVVWLLQHLRWV